MMGRNHIVGNAALAASLAAGTTWAARPQTHVVPHDHELLIRADGWIHAVASWVVGEFHLAHLLMVPVAAWLFHAGGLLPDVDSKRNSTRLVFGRHVHVPLRHRGLTHTDWVLVLLGLLAWLDPTGLVAWLFLGWLCHDLLDELSSAGRCHFYPLTNYVVYTTPQGDEVVVKKRWKGLYTVGKTSETIFLAVLVAVSVLVVRQVWFP